MQHLVMVVLAVLAPCLEVAPVKSSPAEIARLIEQLGDPLYKDRETANKRLLEIGEPALAALQKAATGHPDLEIKRRASRLIRSIDSQVHAKESATLQGRWQAVELEEAGQKVPPRNFSWTLRFAGDDIHWQQVRWTWLRKENGSEEVRSNWSRHEGSFQVRRFDDKKSIDIQYQDNNQPMVLKGILTAEAETLRLCLDLAGETRPDRFETRPGTQCVVLVLKKAK